MFWDHYPRTHRPRSIGRGISPGVNFVALAFRVYWKFLSLRPGILCGYLAVFVYDTIKRILNWVPDENSKLRVKFCRVSINVDRKSRSYRQTDIVIINCDKNGFFVIIINSVFTSWNSGGTLNHHGVWTSPNSTKKETYKITLFYVEKNIINCLVVQPVIRHSFFRSVTTMTADHYSDGEGGKSHRETTNNYA